MIATRNTRRAAARATLAATLLLGATSFETARADIANSAVQGSYGVNGNGFVDTFNLAISSSGVVTGTYGPTKLYGFYDHASQRLTFQRIINSHIPTGSQLFDGYGWVQGTCTASGQPVVVFAGTFNGLGPVSGGTAADHFAGWYAVHNC